ncbi:MAG: hypothetical protein KDB31_09000 [Microthrixaceae bacterium]|nr:hypothetical protein [Microthrixaceae bacterium]
MYDFAKRPLWVLSHVLVLVAVLAMVRLGFWQMSRWHEEQDNAERIEAGMDAAAVPLEDLLVELGDPEATDDVGAEAEYRRVVARGTWDADGEVLVRNRSRDGLPGGWLLTPLVLEDGSSIAVLRGWVPLEVANAGPPYPGTEPPAGEATVTGIVQRTQQGGGLGPSDPATGELDSLARVDLERLGAQVTEPLVPLWLVMQESDPPQPGEVLQPVEVEVPSPSQNFSYMMQWWFFALVAVVGYLLILRKVARSGMPGGRSDVPESDPPEHVHA